MNTGKLIQANDNLIQAIHALDNAWNDTPDNEEEVDDIEIYDEVIRHIEQAGTKLSGLIRQQLAGKE